jgi:Ser/Thr protein kinase RdoA (MazF antagonist)
MEEPTTPRMPDPLSTPPPAFSLENARAIAGRVFGLDVSVSPLDSERDQNVRLDAPGGSFVLKISNLADELGPLDMQIQATLHIARRDSALPVMQPLPTLEGGYRAQVTGPDGRRHFVRAFTFLPGGMVQSSALDRAALHRFGSVVARMGVALRAFRHPAAGYRILWDLKHTAGLRPLLDTVSDDGRRKLVERVLDRFDARVAALLPALRAQVIHNDLTLDNVLHDDAHRVSGIVDFGDLTRTPVICDLAIALVSLMWGRPDPLDVAKTAIPGYTSVSAIEDLEAGVLGNLIGARLAAFVLIANERVRHYPENTAYIMGNVHLAWALLEHLDGLGWPELEKEIEAACRA